MAHSNPINWREVAGQSLSNPWKDVSIDDRSGDCADQGINRIPHVLRQAEAWREKCGGALSCWRGRLAGRKDRAQPLNVICPKCTDLRSNYRLFELEMCMSYFNGCPKHHTRCKAFMPISNESMWRAFCSEFSDMYTSIRILDAESGLVGKDGYCATFFMHFRRSAHQSRLLSMLHCQWDSQ